MQRSVAEAKNQLPKLIRAAESGEPVTITRHGKPVARIVAALPRARKVQFGAMRNRIQLLPGWDDPTTPEEFLQGRW